MRQHHPEFLLPMNERAPTKNTRQGAAFHDRPVDRTSDAYEAWRESVAGLGTHERHESTAMGCFDNLFYKNCTCFSTHDITQHPTNYGLPSFGIMTAASHFIHSGWVRDKDMFNTPQGARAVSVPTAQQHHISVHRIPPLPGDARGVRDNFRR